MKTVILNVVLRVQDDERVADIYAIETKHGDFKDEIVAVEIYEIPRETYGPV